MSHANFGAFFSGQDNSDDCKGRYSVVVGNNQKIIPDIKCRFQYSDKFVDMEIDNLFEDNDNYIEQTYDFKEWCGRLNNVTPPIIQANFSKNLNVQQNNDYSHYAGMFDMNDYYAQYYGNKSGNNQGSSFGVGKCTKCGKFKKYEDLIDIDDEMLCETCLTKLEFDLGV